MWKRLKTSSGRAVLLGLIAPAVAGWTRLEWAAGAEVQAHPVGLSRGPEARVVIKDLVVQPAEPMFEGESFVLTTVGSEHETSEGMEFHPLVSVLIDRSFREAPGGRWLALWNLGERTPNLVNRLRAVFPVQLPSKKSDLGDLRKLERKRKRLEEDPSRAGSRFPEPFLKATEERYRGNEHLVLEGIKRGLGTAVGFWTNVGPITYSANLLYRNYLLRHNDRKERQFEQAYLGLMWYTDLASQTPRAEALSAPAIADLKFKLLASRHFLGRWAREQEAEDFVHGFESQMRDHLWGTSCLLASIANEYHLAYEEFQRYTAGGVPVALGGILYYDPDLAPEPAQVRWPSFNPFDLTYNPFENREVLQAASSGERVPLAIYVYQSNLALKPIIAVDFFDSDNPRTREAATYWHKLGDQALAVYHGAGLWIWAANKSGSFLANRKGLSLFSDTKHSLGLEELRLSLASHLYFEEEAADSLADSMDRLLINPLTQPTRVQAARARVQYLRLARPAQLVQLGRRLRSRQIRKATGAEGPLGSAEWAAYRRYLDRRREMRILEVWLEDQHLPSVPPEQVTASLARLYEGAIDPDPELSDFLLRFRLDLESRPLSMLEPAPVSRIAAVDQLLARLYESEGRPPEELAGDLQTLAEKKEREARERVQEYRREQVATFKDLAKGHLLVLRQFDEHQGDLMVVSPWYLSGALEFFARAPLIMELYPEAEPGFRKLEPELTGYLTRAREYLAENETETEVPWMQEQRGLCLEAADRANRQLARFDQKRKSASGSVRTGGAPGDESGGVRE